jgi:hypothetical protein
MKTVHTVSLLIVILFSANFVDAQTCSSDVTPSIEDPQQAYKFRGNRCEGKISVNTSAPRMLLANFTVGRITYGLDRQAVMELRLPTGEPNEINIRAVPISMTVHYRMDTKMSRSDTLKWPVDEVLSLLPLSYHNLGVYGWYENNNTKFYVPVKMASSTETQCRLVYKCTADVLEVKWRYAQITNGTVRNFTQLRQITGMTTAIEPIEVLLPQSLHGVYLVEIHSKSTDGTPLTIQSRIVLP